MKPFWLLATFRTGLFIGIGAVLIPENGGFSWIRIPLITGGAESQEIRDSWHLTILVTIFPMLCLFQWAGGAFESFVRMTLRQNKPVDFARPFPLFAKNATCNGSVLRTRGVPLFPSRSQPGKYAFPSRFRLPRTYSRFRSLFPPGNESRVDRRVAKLSLRLAFRFDFATFSRACH